jgi:hypothetical protein
MVQVMRSTRELLWMCVFLRFPSPLSTANLPSLPLSFNVSFSLCAFLRSTASLLVRPSSLLPSLIVFFSFPVFTPADSLPTYRRLGALSWRSSQQEEEWVSHWRSRPESCVFFPPTSSLFPLDTPSTSTNHVFYFSAFNRNSNRERSGSLGARLFQRGGNGGNGKSTIHEGEEPTGSSPAKSGRPWRRGSESVPQSPSNQDMQAAAQSAIVREEAEAEQREGEGELHPPSTTYGKAF